MQCKCNEKIQLGWNQQQCPSAVHNKNARKKDGKSHHSAGLWCKLLDPVNVNKCPVCIKCWLA